MDEEREIGLCVFCEHVAGCEMWANESGETLLSGVTEDEGLEPVTMHICPAFKRLPLGPGWVRRGLRAACVGCGLIGAWLWSWGLLDLSGIDARYWLYGGCAALIAILNFW